MVEMYVYLLNKLIVDNIKEKSYILALKKNGLKSSINVSINFFILLSIRNYNKYKF